MRFFNLINFSNLLPSGYTKPSSTSLVSEQSTPMLNILSQNQNIQNLDFEFNTVLTSPEFSNLTTKLNKVNPQLTNTQLLPAGSEMFNYTTLEALTYINSNALNAVDA